MCVSSVCMQRLTFRDLLVQSLQEDALVNVVNMDEVGVVGVAELFKTLKLLNRQTHTPESSFTVCA